MDSFLADDPEELFAEVFAGEKVTTFDEHQSFNAEGLYHWGLASWFPVDAQVAVAVVDSFPPLAGRLVFKLLGGLDEGVFEVSFADRDRVPRVHKGL